MELLSISQVKHSLSECSNIPANNENKKLSNKGTNPKEGNNQAHAEYFCHNQHPRLKEESNAMDNTTHIESKGDSKTSKRYDNLEAEIPSPLIM